MEAALRSSPLALAVLSLLDMGPLHPYGMQRLIKQWGKDQVVNVGNRANLYKTIKRLHEFSLIAVRQTERDQQYPERTVYELTEAGRQLRGEWLTMMLSAPHNEFPTFPAALSFAMLLGPEATQAALERRLEVLRGDLSRLEGELAGLSGTLPRVTLLESEYQRAVASAEITWLAGVVEDLQAGVLTWGEELATMASSSLPA